MKRKKIKFFLFLFLVLVLAGFLVVPNMGSWLMKNDALKQQPGLLGFEESIILFYS